MRILITAATLAVGFCVLTPAQAFSGNRSGLLTAEQARAYHACLFEAYIQDYCHETSSAPGQCVIANGGGRYPLDGRLFTDDYCWYTAQGLTPR
jgi:hypothetical protein